MQQESLKRFNKRKIHHFAHLGYIGASLELTYNNLIHLSDNDHTKDKLKLKDLPYFSFVLLYLIDKLIKEIISRPPSIDYQYILE